MVRLAPERRDGETRAAQNEADDRLVTVVGALADVSPGEAIQASGWWKNDPKYGWQFVAVDYRTTLPATVQGMKKYLGSGLVKGVGPVNAGRIVDAFGEATFEIIDETPERLTEVPGIGPVRAARIAATWAEQRQVREVMAALQSHGISTSLAARIYRRFGDESAAGHRPGALPPRPGGVGDRVQDGGQDRPGHRHRPGRPGAPAGRRAARARRRRRRRQHPAPRAGPGRAGLRAARRAAGRPGRRRRRPAGLRRGHGGPAAARARRRAPAERAPSAPATG